MKTLLGRSLSADARGANDRGGRSTSRYEDDTLKSARARLLSGDAEGCRANGRSAQVGRRAGEPRAHDPIARGSHLGVFACEYVCVCVVLV